MHRNDEESGEEACAASGEEYEDAVAEEKPSLQVVLKSLPLFDELFLGMQAINLDMVDSFIESAEAELLRRYIEIERTPPETMFVSAVSQLWIFGVYELLRTWRQRVADLLNFAGSIHGLSDTEREARIEQRQEEIKRLSEHSVISPWKDYDKVASDPAFGEALENAYDRSELLFRRLEALRVSLAKHEVPKTGKGRSMGMYAMAPGYGRIDMTSGSIQWQIVLQGNEVDLVSRQDIADECRRLATHYSKTILPRSIQPKMKDIPKHSYATKRVRLRLKNGEMVPGVLVAWDKQVVFVTNRDRLTFDALDVVDVEHDPLPEQGTSAPPE